MAKRLTCSDKWQDPWFRKLTPELKCVWLFLLDKCDNAGVWKKDIDLMEFVISCSLDENNILDNINNGKKRIALLDNEKWLVVDFIRFQWKNNTKMLPNINKLCIEHGIDIDSLLIGDICPIDRTKVKVKVKTKDKVKDKVKSIDFEEFKYLKDNNFLKIFNSYCSGRKKKPTEHAKELALKKLHKFDILIAIKMLENSIMNGWEGIFEIKENGYGKDRPGSKQFDEEPGKYDGVGTTV